MFILDSQNGKRILAGLLTAGVVALGFACAGVAAHASAHSDMSPVSVMRGDSQQECCGANTSKYVSLRKNALLVVPHELRSGSLFLLGLMAIFWASRLRPQLAFISARLLLYKLYIRANPNLALFNYLKVAFARGILNSKVY